MLDVYQLSRIEEVLENSGFTNDLFNLRYTWSVANNGDLELSSRDNNPLMPVIRCTIEYDDSAFYWEPNMIFPNLMREDISFNDSFEAWTREWLDVSKICTYLMKTEWEWEPDE